MAKLRPIDLAHSELLHYLPLETSDQWALQLHANFHKMVEATLEERLSDQLEEIADLEREIEELKSNNGR